MKTFLTILMGIILFSYPVLAAPPMLTSATISEVKNEAQLFLYDTANKETIRAAQVKDTLYGSRILRTGKSSRAELEFNDKSIARIGANTLLSFKNHTRQLELQKGTLLLQVPKGYGNTQVATPAATCSVIGTTILLQHLQLANGQQRSINIVLEGLMNVTVNGKTHQVPGGSALISNGPGAEPQVVKVDIASFMSSSMLINQFSTLTSNEAIQAVIDSQKNEEVESLDKILDTSMKSLARELQTLPPPPPPSPNTGSGGSGEVARTLPRPS